MAADFLFSVDKDCPICRNKFPVTKVRSKLRLEKQDGDFCNHYKEMNPNYYVVWVCPHCGYAAPDTHFSELSVAAEEKVRGFLKNKEVRINLSGERTREQAIASYKLAIFQAELINMLPSRLGGLYLKLAWIFREAEQSAEEKLLLFKARECYEQATLKEKFPIGGMTMISVEYLIGELYRRCGELDQALAYLSKVVGNPQAKLEKRILEMAKEAWHAAREEKRQQLQTAQE